MDLLYSQPRRFSLSIALDELGLFRAISLSLSLLALVQICLVNCFTFLLANFPPFRVWHFHGLSSQLASCRLILVCSATCVLEFDDSTSESPLSLLTICTHSTFSLAARYLFDTCCVLTFATCLDAHCARGFDDSVHKSLLHTVCATFTLAFAIVLLFLLSDLSVTESSTDSTLIWLLSLLALLAAMLWQRCLSNSEGHFTVTFTTLFDGVLLLKTLMSPVQLAPLSGPFLEP